MGRWSHFTGVVKSTVGGIIDPLGVVTGNNVLSSIIPGIDLTSFDLSHPFSSKNLEFWGLLALGGVDPGLATVLALLLTSNSRSKTGLTSVGTNSGPSKNLYFLTLTPYLNEIQVGTKAFNLGGFTSLTSIKGFLDSHPNSYNYDFCSPTPNSTLRLVFDDIEFTDNSGVINVGICYVGTVSECCVDTTPKETLCVSLSYNIVDPNMTYPIPCHGQVYVGDENTGLSTGGRCEYNDLCDVEKELLKRYSSSYIPEFNALETQSDLVKNRVLDLVYKNDGVTWVRQQNMLDSVYHHCGVGNVNHSIYWGGIHDSITDFEFSYNHSYAEDMSASSYVPAISAWLCENRTIESATIIDAGIDYSDIFINKQIYEIPYWKNITPQSLLFDNPQFVDVTTLIPPKSNSFLKYSRDSDFPAIKLISLYSADDSGFISFNGATKYSNLMYNLNAESLTISGSISGNPSILTGITGSIATSECIHAPHVGSGIGGIYMDWRANQDYQACLQKNKASSNGDYLGKTQSDDVAFDILAATISGGHIITGRMYLKEIYIDINGAGYIYPADMDSTKPKSNEQFFLQILKIGMDEFGGQLWYTVNYVFKYTTLNNLSGSYALVADGSMLFGSLDNIWKQSIVNKLPVATNCYTNVLTNVTSAGATSNIINSGPGKAGLALQTTGALLFDLVDADGLMIGVENSDEIWTASLEECGDTITSFLDINAQIGQRVKPRWGTALWCLAFDSGSANFNFSFNYDYSKETADENNGLLHYETATVDLSSSSIASILNNRILLQAHSIEQDQHYDTINNAVVAGIWSITGALYTQTDITSCTPILSTTIDTSCSRAIAEQLVQSNLTGTITFDCSSCAYTTDISSQMSFNNKTTTTEGNTVYRTMNYDILSPCSLMISGSQVYPAPGSPTITEYVISSINPNLCVAGSLNEMLTAAISGYLVGSPDRVYDADTYIVPISSSVLPMNANHDITGTIYCNVKSPEKWVISSVRFIPESACTETTSFAINPAYFSGFPRIVAETAVNGAVTYTGGSCCSGAVNFPIPSLTLPWRGFVYNNTEIVKNMDFDVVAAVTYNVSAAWCSDMVGSLIITMNAAQETTMEVYFKECAVGNLAVGLIGCEFVKSPPISAQNLIFSTTLPPSGYTYSEWATAFVQEYRDDSRYNISDNWIISNAYDISTKNTGRLYKNSLWKRYMDGVGLGGDAPDYDTIINAGTFNENPIENWACIGAWNVGQMAFGDPNRAVIAGGHKVNRAIGEYGIGMGINAPLSTTRTYLWDYTNIPEEDSYLRNYMGRRFNASYTSSISSSIFPISSCENASDLNCVIFDAESEMIVERTGSIFFDGSKDSQTITFDKAFPDSVGTNYSISLTLSDNVRSWWSNKSATSFDVFTEIKGWSGHIDYIASAIVKVTEQDISNLGPQDPYTFDK